MLDNKVTSLGFNVGFKRFAFLTLNLGLYLYIYSHMRKPVNSQQKTVPWGVMNKHNLQHNTAVSTYEEMRGLISISDHRNGGAIFCPKPRRIRVLTLNLRLHKSHESEVSDSKAGAEILDIILNKEGLETEQEQCIASSPLFFHGSPPSRAVNPLVQDARFSDERLAQARSAVRIPSPSSSFGRKTGCIRMKFGLKPAAVRVEGFDCLSS